ncbi:MAG: organic solvent tolerance protein OstA [Pirellulales bacterium]|nr:organic solvent tolerance protein OstA [Pirellulales bacterium]
MRSRCARLLGTLLLGTITLLQGEFSSAYGQGTRIKVPAGEFSDAILISAGGANRWREDRTDVWLLSGGVEIRQGATLAKAEGGVLWLERGRYGEKHSVNAYLDGNVLVSYAQDGSQATLREPSWYGTWESSEPPTFNTPQPGGEVSHESAPILGRAKMRRYAYSDGAFKQVNYQDESRGAATGAGTLPSGSRRIRAYPRSSTPVQASYFLSPDGRERIGTIDSGVNVIIEGDDRFGTVDVSADRVVVWTSENLSLDGSEAQDADQPLELYLEGNVVFRQGERVMHAQRMYYDARREIGTIVAAEILTPLESYEGLIRLKADVVQQISRDRFVATNSFVTTSRLGDPSYRLSSGTVYFEDKQKPAVDPLTGIPVIDPLTGEQAIDHDRSATSLNNFIFLEETPIGYWPIFAANLERPTYYLRRISFANDNIFGTQILTDWDPYQILGIENPPPGTDWDFSLDWLSERGFGHGTRFSYQGMNLLNVPSTYAGLVDFWGIEDRGLDTLGQDRGGLTPEKNYRFRLFGRQRLSLPGDLTLSTELGWISDRNFLEQYFESEWDTFKDLSTGGELKKIIDNSVWSLSGDVQLNSFFTQTQGAEAQHTWLGESLFSDRITWYENTKIGYRDIEVATTPEDPVDASKFMLLPWEVDNEGLRFATRHELDMPLQAGPAKVVPYVMGEFAHWDEDVFGDQLDRLYGKLGVRASLPIWSVNPGVENDLFNVHGLAHKVVFELDGSVADANEDIFDLPLYDPLQDDAQEHFLRRAQFNTFGGMPIPAKFDDRVYALRSGLGDWVTSPSTEIVDDLATVRMGVHQRWQTRRGFPGRRRTLDWIVLDSDITLFPDADRDNFGQEFGLASYGFRWHVGDRLVLTSDGMADMFGDGMRIVRVGGQLSRPPRGSVFVNFSSLEGPISSQLLSFSYNYRMSPKWISSLTTSFDFGEDVNLGQNVAVTRIGESFLVTFGFSVDATRDNVGVTLAIEPRFLPGLRFGQYGSGARVPPAGLNGIE